MAEEHLYRGEGSEKAKEGFEKRYGKEHGDKVYGATVGKVHREQVANGTARSERKRRRRK